MGFFDNVFETTDPANAAKGIFSRLGFNVGGGSVANKDTALTLSAFFNGVNIISNDIAKLPKAVYLKDGKSREIFRDHPVNYIISKRPNSLMTSFDFWKVIVVLVILKGNAYVQIKRNKDTGDLEQLFLLENEDVTVRIINKKLFYFLKGKNVPLMAKDVLHFKHLTFDGVNGVSVIKYAARNLGINLDSQTYISDVYKDRGVGFGVVETVQKVDSAQKKAIESAISEKLSSGEKFRIPLLDQGFQYKSINISPAEAQFLDTHKFGVIDVARWLNIAPYKLKDLSNSNFSNMFQMAIEHVQDSILPWSTSFEMEMDVKLFSDHEKNVFVKFNVNALLRGDLDSKRNYYSTMVYAGIMTRNEVRALEDLNPLDNLDEPLTPVNMELMDHLIKKNEKMIKDE